MLRIQKQDTLASVFGSRSAGMERHLWQPDTLPCALVLLRTPLEEFTALPLHQGWLDMYCRYILLIYIGYFCSKISDTFDRYDFYGVFFYFLNVTHREYVLILV